jgi:hypothetical protein
MNTQFFRTRFRVLLLSAVLAMLAVITFAPRLHGQSLVVSNMWSISTAEARSYVSATANERGVAYNPVLGYAYIVSRNGTPAKIARVDAATGLDLGSLDTNGVSGGTFLLSQIGVADDGAIYAANLTTGSAGTSSSGPFRLYRWPDDGSAPTPIYIGNPMVNSGNSSIRLGDVFDVRGSGANTEIIAAANATNVVCVFRPTDETLTTFTQSVIVVTGAANTDFVKGLTFGPTNTFFGKNNGGTLRLCSYNYVAGTNGSGGSLRTYSILSTLAAIDYDPVRGLLGGVQTVNAAAPHSVVLYDLSSGTPNIIYTNSFPAPGAANANAVGGINILSNRMISVATVNGVQMTAIEESNEAIPPTITSPVGALTIVQGGYASFNIAANGTKPLTYQWFKDGTELTNQTNTTIIFTNVSPSDAGSYHVQVLNYAGSANSTGTVTISSAVLSTVATNLWRIQPGNPTYPWIATDSSSRGMAYNPANNTLIVCSRTSGNSLYVLDAETGVLLRQMSFNGSGGTFAINMVGCAEDGRIFACNLTTDGTTVPFKVYVWPSDAAGVDPTAIYSGDPGNGSHDRWGDNFDVQGGGVDVQDIRILAGSRNGKLAFLIRDVGLLTYDDLLPINVPDVNPGSFGLSVALAEENSFWGKANGTTNYLVKVAYDPATGAGTPVRFITNSVLSVVGYNLSNQWIGGISLETPDNVRLYDVATTPATALDTEISPTDNANANGTGSVKFGLDRMFVLESNNGIAAFKLAPLLRKSRAGNILTLAWQGNHTLQASGSVSSGYTNVTTISGYQIDVSNTGTTFFRLAE